eukprot:8156695-Lingulodinium_polyedra.AAC.1
MPSEARAAAGATTSAQRIKLRPSPEPGPCLTDGPMAGNRRRGPAHAQSAGQTDARAKVNWFSGPDSPGNSGGQPADIPQDCGS